MSTAIWLSLVNIWLKTKKKYYRPKVVRTWKDPFLKNVASNKLKMIKLLLFLHNDFFNSSLKSLPFWIVIPFFGFKRSLCVVNSGISVSWYLGVYKYYDDNKRCDFSKLFFPTHHDFWQRRQSWNVSFWYDILERNG